MNFVKNHLEFITPCFCGGAEPEKQAEVRAPSIRGQLRWWFRTLGGFKSLSPMSVREQESMIFGSTAGDRGSAGKLIVRVGAFDQSKPLYSNTVKDADGLDASVQQPKGYLLFPLRSNRKKGINAGRGVFEGRNVPRFELRLVWRGKHGTLNDIKALIGVWGHLGGLGFRQRRAMGAVAFIGNAPELKSCLDHFSHSVNLSVKSLPATDADSAIINLANWLKGWRSHGRRIDHERSTPPNPPHNPGYDPYAKNDHDRGIDVTMERGQDSDVTYRPALGLPIIQFFSSGKQKVDWNQKWDSDKARRNRKYNGEGRFASPILLRPHKDAQGMWRALVVFVDANRWPEDEAVFLNGKLRRVSLNLYEAMKNDKHLRPFPS